MTNDNNLNPISNDDITKAKEYKQALDDLRNSVISLNSKLPSFADGVKAGLQAVGEKLPEVVEAMKKLNDQNKQLAENGQKPKSVLKELASSLLSWNGLVSVGITLLAAYSGVIIDWISDMIKGETTLSALGKAMKDQKLILQAVNDARIQGNNNAQQELVHLKLLYDASQDQNISLDKRKRIVKDLQDQYPAIFGNLKTEEILAGKAKKTYDQLTSSILASARARAAEDLMVNNQKRQLGNSERSTQLITELHNIDDQIKAAEKQQKKLQNMIIIGSSTITAGTESKDTASEPKIDRLYLKRNELIKKLADLKTDSDILTKRNKALSELVIAGNYQEEPVKTVKNNKNNSNSSNKNKREKTRYSRQELLPDAIAPKLVLQTEQDKKAYEQQLDQLNDQLSKKLISEDEYYKQSKDLQQKYHQHIEAMVKNFTGGDMDKALEQLNNVIEANRLQEIISKDKKKVEKTILPGQKLEAEKQLITDKYNYEILLANGNAEKIKELEEKKQEDLTNVTRSYEQQRKEFALNTAQQVADKAFSIIGSNIKSSSDAKIKGLEKDKAAELNNKNLTATQRKAIEDKYRKKENEEKVKAFKAEQKASILQAVVNGALAITKATSQTGILAPFVIPGIIASTALQVATILAQKPPAYAKGGRFVSDGRGALLPGYSRTDDTNAYLRSGEAVVVSEAMRNPWARNLVSAINVAHGGRDFSVPNTSYGYAVGGIYTDGGNANRYYNQPVNDIKEMANTLAYQMINNFPPIYVDVKDVNNQQNILAQTVNRVNL
ncbi:hypothetical protein DYU05_08905 [Mucilaginibacter terrenus]|uniref:Phage tail tape measure protein n=1 Tax=Mucilaginibacter terrenus TaxID=2482727 RepID=A0A3E2NXF3_9SPHI|nr:hypothetical protein [Mucilaginibacter terrenus]RFZ85698.1 hypothetical protein DYU05_08905 [Mucilaginibacter terrenus]